jgi:hypothetical protein
MRFALAHADDPRRRRIEVHSAAAIHLRHYRCARWSEVEFGDRLPRRRGQSSRHNPRERKRRSAMRVGYGRIEPAVHFQLKNQRAPGDRNHEHHCPCG